MGVPRAAQALAPRAEHPQDLGPEGYLNGTSQGAIPEDAGLPARLRPVGDYAPEGRAYSSERRTFISTVGVADS